MQCTFLSWNTVQKVCYTPKTILSVSKKVRKYFQIPWMSFLRRWKSSNIDLKSDSKNTPDLTIFVTLKKVVWNILVFWPYISSRIRDTNCKNCGHSVFELLHITVSQSITVVVEFLPSSQFARNFSHRCPSVRKWIYPNIVLAASRQTFTKN